MNKIFKFMMIAAAASMFAACEETPVDPVNPDDEKPKDEEVVLNQNLEFTLEVTTVEADNAKVKIEHNGTTADTWYGFYTSEVSKSDSELIQAEVAALTAAGKISGLKKQTSTTVTLRGLEPQTDYKYIALGLTADGEVYGVYKSITFKTLRGEVVYTENPAWTVNYEGAGTIQGQAYEHTVSVTSTDKNLYFIAGVEVAEFESKGIKTIAEENIQYMKEFLNAFNSENGTKYTILDMLFQGNGIDALNLEAGDWYGLAIGVDETGEPTGLYAKSEVISIEEEEMSAEYAAWLGDWTFTGSNGVAFDVTMNKGIANKTYKLAGWEGPESEGLDITVDWMAEDGLWVIFAQSFGVYSFGDAGNGEIWFVPEDTDGYIYPAAGIPACLGGMTEDGTRVVIGYSEEAEDGSVIEMASMLYLVKLEVDSQYYTITSTTEWPTFPLTVTPTAATKSASSVEFKGVQSFTKMPKAYKIADFNKAYMIR